MFSLGVFERKVLSLHYKQLNMAKKKGEYEKFRRIQDKTLMSDFDKFIEGLDSK